MLAAYVAVTAVAAIAYACAAVLNLTHQRAAKLCRAGAMIASRP